MAKSRLPCKFFLQGNCNRGDRCDYSHERPFSGRGANGRFNNRDNNRNNDNNNNNPFGRNNGGFGGQNGFGGQGGFGGGRNNNRAPDNKVDETTRKLAIEELQCTTLWPFSGFSVHKGLPNIVDGDLSFEEVRWEAYQQVKATGTCAPHTQAMQAAMLEMQQKKNQVIAAMEDLQMASRLLAGEKLTTIQRGMASDRNPFGSGGGGSVATPKPFGSQQPTFGQSGQNPFAVASTSPFTSTTSGTANTFGAATMSPFTSTTSGTANAFDVASTSPFISTTNGTANAFGAVPASPFTSTKAGPMGSSSPFGAATTFPSTSNPVGSSNPFGGGNGNNQPQSVPSSSPFGVGGASSTPSIPFGGVSTTFSSTPSTTSRNTLGSNAPLPSSFSTPSPTVFGNVTTSTFGSGTTTAIPSSTPFGQPHTTVPFGGTIGSTTPYPTQKSMPASIGHSSQVVTKPPPRVVTEEERTVVRDEAWNAQQFESATFRIGMVPTVPPPPQFC